MKKRLIAVWNRENSILHKTTPYLTKTKALLYTFYINSKIIVQNINTGSFRTKLKGSSTTGFQPQSIVLQHSVKSISFWGITIPWNTSTDLF